jgi:hypothetical protein
MLHAIANLEKIVHGSQPSSLPILLLEFLQRSFTQSFLGILEIDETLFDGTIHDETDGLDGSCLSDAMHTIHLRTERVNITTHMMRTIKINTAISIPEATRKNVPLGFQLRHST